MAQCLGRWIPNLGVPGSKPLVGSKVDLVFHSSKIDQVSIFIYLFIAEDMLLQEDLLKLLPMINEANAMSEELDKKVGQQLIQSKGNV